MFEVHKKCGNCLKLGKEEPGVCAHPEACMILGWMGRAIAVLFGWPRWTFAAESKTSDESVAQPVHRYCRACNTERPAPICWKCGAATEVLSLPNWEPLRLPDVARIRALAKEVGYAIGEHGSQERDLDLIAAPWSETAVDHLTLATHIAQGIDARVVDGGPKPLGRYAYNLQINGWYKVIDLSVCPRLAP